MIDKTIIYYDAKNADNYITIMTKQESELVCYSYYRNETCTKSSFNKWAFIEFLKGAGVRQKYIRAVENS